MLITGPGLFLPLLLGFGGLALALVTVTIGLRRFLHRLPCWYWLAATLATVVFSRALVLHRFRGVSLATATPITAIIRLQLHRCRFSCPSLIATVPAAAVIGSELLLSRNPRLRFSAVVAGAVILRCSLYLFLFRFRFWGLLAISITTWVTAGRVWVTAGKIDTGKLAAKSLRILQPRFCGPSHFGEQVLCLAQRFLRWFRDLYPGLG